MRLPTKPWQRQSPRRWISSWQWKGRWKTSCRGSRRGSIARHIKQIMKGSCMSTKLRNVWKRRCSWLKGSITSSKQHLIKERWCTQISKVVDSSRKFPKSSTALVTVMRSFLMWVIHQTTCYLSLERQAHKVQDDTRQRRTNIQHTKGDIWPSSSQEIHITSRIGCRSLIMQLCYYELMLSNLNLWM